MDHLKQFIWMLPKVWKFFDFSWEWNVNSVITSIPYMTDSGIGNVWCQKTDLFNLALSLSWLNKFGYPPLVLSNNCFLSSFLCISYRNVLHNLLNIRQKADVFCCVMYLSCLFIRPFEAIHCTKLWCFTLYLKIGSCY